MAHNTKNTENTENLEDITKKIEEIKEQEREEKDNKKDTETSEEAEPKLTDLEKCKAEKAELNDKILRTTADIQNMKRRAIDDRISARFNGAKDLLLPITKTIDDLNRAFAHIPEDLQENEFIKSVQVIEENLNKTLAEQGVEFFGEPTEKFDANFHDSMMLDPNTKKDTIAQVFEKGIKLKNKVVRHAKVSVGSK